MERNYDILEAWRERAANLQARTLQSGHYLAEEPSEETAAALESFFSL